MNKQSTDTNRQPDRKRSRNARAQTLERRAIRAAKYGGRR